MLGVRRYTFLWFSCAIYAQFGRVPHFVRVAPLSGFASLRAYGTAPTLRQAQGPRRALRAAHAKQQVRRAAFYHSCAKTYHYIYDFTWMLCSNQQMLIIKK